MTFLLGIYRGTWPAQRAMRWVLFGAVLAAGALVALGTPNRLHRWAVFLTAFVLYPGAVGIRQAVAKRWRPLHTALLAGLVCGAFGFCIVTWGNHQYAGPDHSLMVDVGWRLFRGQIPYRDFICTLPPGFLAGLRYAYQMFGARWDAILYVDVIFACLTFVWMYKLLSAILRSRVNAFLAAIAIECAGVLAGSYWWYNNIASVTATIFFLSCLLYLRQPDSAGAQLSYVAALAMIGTMKPNTAVPLIFGCVILVFIATKARARFTALTMAGVACLLGFLMLNQFHVLQMIGSYRAAAAARGISAFGFMHRTQSEKIRVTIYVGCMLLPGFVLWWKQLRDAIGRRDIRALSVSALLALAPVVGVYAMFTNGEMKDTDFPLMICFGAVTLWGRTDQALALPGLSGTTWKSEAVLRLYASFLVGLAVSDLYLGASRNRLEFSEGVYFERADAEYNPGVPYFQHMRASKRMQDVIAQMAQVLRDSGRPVFFGPNLEFGYAAFEIDSPPHLPLWWYAGSSFTAADEPSIAEAFRSSGFPTLVFLRGDPTDTTSAIQRMIRESYVEDDRWPQLTVYRLRNTAQRGHAGATFARLR